MAAISWVPHTVAYKDSLSLVGGWTVVDGLMCPQITRGLAPTLDQATLQYRFGTIDGVYVPRLVLAGKFVLIDVPGISEFLYGIALSEQYVRGPQEDNGLGAQRIKRGDQSFQVAGLEWYLTRQTINHSIIYPDIRIDRALGFNTGFGDGRDVAYADRGNKDTRGLAFAVDKDHAEIWTADEIVAYLLAEHGPKDKDGIDEPATYVLATGAASYLTGFAPILRCEGNSVWQALNQVISPQRGLTWWTQYDGTSDVEVFVSSTAVTSVSLPGGGTLPAADTQPSIDDVDPRQMGVSVARRNDRRFDRVVVRGARRRSVFTISHAAGTMAKSWLDAEETAYKAAAADADPAVNDRFRQANRYEPVYQFFHVPTDWDGEISTGVKACPAFVQGSGSIVGGEKLHLASMRLLNELPIRVGWDYADATAPTVRDPTNIRSEFQRPFAMIDIGDDDWRFAHEINTNSETSSADKLTGYTYRPLAGTPGFQLSPSGGMPHALGLNHFDPEVDAVSQHDPECDYETIQCTVCAEWDAYCEGYWPVALADSKPLQTLYVTIDGDRARFDWLAEGTVYDIQAGAQAIVTTGGALRDDRSLCADLARLAYEWHGVERAELQIELATIEAPARVGDLITTIGTGEAQETINSVVSQVTYDLENGRMNLIAGFSELDFSTIV